MPLQLYVSNSLERLSQKLTDDLRELQGSVFMRPSIVTQTEGINSWLKIQMAYQLGIASNLSFFSPTDIIGAVYQAVCRKRMPPAGAHQLQWMIYSLLGEADFIRQFPTVSDYYLQQESKRQSLAIKIADLFDQYQVYRPQHIEQWNKGQLDNDPDLHWQSFLWHRLILQYGAVFTDRTTITQEILEALQLPENREKLQRELPHIYFFGMAIITPFYLNLFQKISEITSISFYLNNPAPETYWMDQVTEKVMAKILQRDKRRTPEHFHLGNDLLLNWGKVIKDSFYLLFNEEHFLNVYDDSLAIPPAAPQTLLHKIQADIYNNAVGPDRQTLVLNDIKDGTISIHSSYTPAREVEALYNYLVHLIDRKKQQLAPRDILVMVNDIDQYAPFIRAVFDNAPYTFPYNIADESINQGNTIFSAIQQLLDIKEEVFTSEKIIDLLDNKYIRNRFGITQTELIRKALQEANIRFGWEGNSDNDTRYFSWEYGLQRLLLGICINGAPLIESNGEWLEPVDSFEGDDSWELVRLIHFVKTLRRYMVQNTEIRPLGEWMTYLKNLVEALVFEAGNQEDDDYHLFIKYAERLEGDEYLSDIPVSFEAFRKGFIDRLSTEKRKHAFIRGGITFCSFIPMRSVPFKVVAMLGLNYDQFPRKENTISFSLLSKKQEKGDRNVKENDKHLLLETLLSARDFLYLSYCGRNVHDGSVLPPSLLLEELTDYVIKGVFDHPEQVRKEWITEHPLHGFSKKYNQNEQLYTYLSHAHLQHQIELFQTDPPVKTFNFKELELMDMIRFFENPVKWYFNKVLGIYYRKSESLLLPEEEVFELNQWKINDLGKKLMQADEQDLPDWAKKEVRNGALPLSNMGIMTIHEAYEKMKPLRQIIQNVTRGAIPFTHPFELEVDGTLLTGNLTPIYDQQLLAIANIGEKNQVAWLGGYLQYLIARALQLSFSLTLIYHTKEYESYTIPADRYTPQKAMEKLTACLQLFKSGHERPLSFCPLTKDYSKVFLIGPDAFLSEISRMRNAEKSREAFSDAYVEKADENDYFDVASYSEFESNTAYLFSDFNI